MVVSSPDLDNIQGRIECYRMALSEAGLQDWEQIVVGGITVESSRAAVIRCLDRPDRPTALFAATNIVALGAIHAIRDLDLEFHSQHAPQQPVEKDAGRQNQGQWRADQR